MLSIVVVRGLAPPPIESGFYVASEAGHERLALAGSTLYSGVYIEHKAASSHISPAWEKQRARSLELRRKAMALDAAYGLLLLEERGPLVDMDGISK